MVEERQWVGAVRCGLGQGEGREEWEDLDVWAPLVSDRERGRRRFSWNGLAGPAAGPQLRKEKEGERERFGLLAHSR